MKKGFYFIGTNQYDKDGISFFGPELQEGSHEEYGTLFIHRKKDYEGNPNMWKVTHKSTGAAITERLDLKSARLQAKKLQTFKLWEIKTYEEIRETIAESQHNPESPYYEDIKAIQNIRHLRA
tara:strand:- start:66 stop:434 length:369 start_codon:yes stop_codon:yes gene_type:complete